MMGFVNRPCVTTGRPTASELMRTLIDVGSIRVHDITVFDACVLCAAFVLWVVGAACDRII